ncbi:MAG: non-homologous end-joining DNA ligase [Cyclobacteriaceae bacterium]
MSLLHYNNKRNFKNTPEPSGKKKTPTQKHTFVVQRHQASNFHYDFRLEVDGVLKSWAVPKGPSMNPKDKRFAVMVEDHPLRYGNFAGEIPEGNYGAGAVVIWDHGIYELSEGESKNEEIQKKLSRGSLKFSLHGENLRGTFGLVKMKDGKNKNWLLIKHQDEFAVTETYDIESIKSEPIKTSKKNVGSKSVAKSKKQTGTGNVKPITKTTGKKGEQLTVNGHLLNLTNQEKIYWPDEKITKGDIIKYYNMVSPYILPYLKNRPQSLKRNPNGITDNGFFHKDAGRDAPPWVDTISLRAESANKNIEYILCNKKATLLYLNNLGCIELNPWHSKVSSLDFPDYMVMDLDPSENNSFEQIIDTAIVVKEILDKAGAKAYCKTSGATGLHIYVPLKARYTYDDIRAFSEIIAMKTNEILPQITTVERALNKRDGRIYLDYLQNKKGQTLASVYSVRPKPGATVSTPLLWQEVKSGLHPSQFTIHNLEKRLRKGDLFNGVLKESINLKKCLKNLGV